MLEAKLQSGGVSVQQTSSQGVFNKGGDGSTLAVSAGHGAGGGCEGQQGLGSGHGGGRLPLSAGGRNLSCPQPRQTVPLRCYPLTPSLLMPKDTAVIAWHVLFPQLLHF